MSTTGTEVHNNLPMTGADTSKSLLAVKAAVDESQRWHLLTEYASAVDTFVTDTFTYSLAALSPQPHPELGIAQVFINESTTEPEVGHTEWKQHFDQSLNSGAGAWTLTFAPSLVSSWVGKTFNALYQYPHPAVAALTDSLYLPYGYVSAYVMYWYAQQRLSEENVDVGHWTDLLVANRDAWQYYRKHKPTLLPAYNKVGSHRMRVW